MDNEIADNNDFERNVKDIQADKMSKMLERKGTRK
jgi:hypothetical protein